MDFYSKKTNFKLIFLKLNIVYGPPPPPHGKSVEHILEKVIHTCCNISVVAQGNYGFEGICEK